MSSTLELVVRRNPLASRPISRGNLLRFRLKQERFYTLQSAQLVCDGSWIPSTSELVGLNRLARSHFGHSFYELVEQCDDMVLVTIQKANEVSNDDPRRPSLVQDLGE